MRTKTCAIGIAISLSLLSSIGLADDVALDKGFIATHNSTDRISIVQCGLDSTIFALEYFHIQYPLDKVSSGLPFTEKGILFSDIGAMLTAFGLDIEFRKKVSVRQLSKAINSGTLAIIPLKVGHGYANSHYYIAALDDHQRPVFLDPGRKVVPLRKGLLQGKYDELEGLTMFVRRKKNSAIQMSKQITISPKIIELGKLLTNGPDNSRAMKTSLSVHNTSDIPIMVSSIQQSCGCTKVDWKGGLLRPGKNRTLQFSVLPGSWGVGSREKMVLFTFGDGSSRRIAIRGVGITVEEEQRIDISQKSIRLDISEKHLKNTMDVRVTRVTMFGPPLSKLNITSKTDWLKPRIVPVNLKSGEVWVEFDRDRAIKVMGESLNRLKGELILSTNGDFEPVRIEVEVIRRDAFYVKPGFLRISSGNSEVHKLLVYSNDQKTRVKVINVRSLPPGLTADFFNHQGRCGLEIRVKNVDIVSPGFYDVLLDIESSEGNQDTIRVSIQLVP